MCRFHTPNKPKLAYGERPSRTAASFMGRFGSQAGLNRWTILFAINDGSGTDFVQVRMPRPFLLFPPGQTNRRKPTIDPPYNTNLKSAVTDFLHKQFSSSTLHHGTGYSDCHCCLPSDHRNHGSSAPRSTAERQGEASGPEDESFREVFEDVERRA
jgi:hypothetical protein